MAIMPRMRGEHDEEHADAVGAERVVCADGGDPMRGHSKIGNRGASWKC